MLNVPEGARIYLCLEITDMRRSFDMLSGMVAGFLGKDPLSGHFFIFRNKAADRLKILYWDASGFCLWYKRLEKGHFVIPHGLKADFEMSRTGFERLMKGAEPWTVGPRKS